MLVAGKKDYYEVLGINKSATDDEIKKAYRGLAKKYHPDANPGDKAAEESFKEVGEAYDVLSDSNKKSAYDQFGHSAFDQGMGGGGYSYSGGFDASDIFEQFFGGGFDFFGSGGGSRRKGPQRGADVQVRINVSFEEAYYGSTKNIQVDLMETCDACKGNGAKAGTVPETCKRCNGTGQERVLQQTMFGTMTQVKTCSECDGEGKIIREKCPKCFGKGQIRRSQTMEVTIPKGISDGQKVRLQGKGEPGLKGGPHGDMLVVVLVEPHKTFIRKENDILVDVPISFAEATLGADIKIPVMGGTESKTLKAGTQTGTVITLKGKGFPDVLNNKISGDLLVTLVVAVPTSLTDKQRQALELFAEEMGEEVKEQKRGLFKKFR